MREHIKIGSRGSRLALVQSRQVMAQLGKLHPDLKFELIEITTEGDRNREISLEKLGGEGVFVKELEEALLDKRIDLAVHSLKDMPTEIPKGLKLAAASVREDPRDVLVSRSGKVAGLPPGARIGTGSSRRSLQLLALRPDLHIAGLRGNIDTRLSRISPPEGLDGIIMAAAALNRLGKQDRITEYLAPEVFVPAVGQGALGFEIRADDEYIDGIVATLNDKATWQAVTAERAYLRALGGGCRSPIAALGRVEGSVLKLFGMVADPQGRQILRAEVSGNATDPEEVGNELARQMIRLGAGPLIAEVKAS